MSQRVGKIAGRQNVRIAVVIKVGDNRMRRSVQRKEIALGEVVTPVVFQNPHTVVGLQNARVVEVVSVHVEDVWFAVAVEIGEGEKHRAVDRREPRQNLPRRSEIPFAVVRE